MPTDLEQATGLERLEILGKMEGVDIFDMRPLDASRLGTMEDPIAVRSAGEEQFAGCTGFPADSHVVTWLGVSAYGWIMDMTNVTSFPRSDPSSDAPSAAASTRWSTLVPSTTTITTRRSLRSPRPLPTTSSPSTDTDRCIAG